MKRLVGQALRWFKEEGLNTRDDILSATGMSAEDLAYNAVLEVLRDVKARWQPERPDEDPYAFIVRVMRNDFLDLVKPGRAYKRVLVVDTQANNEGQPALDNYETAQDGMDKAHTALVANDLYKVVGEDQELKDMIAAVLLLDRPKREDIASLLDITPEEVTNRQRRLRNKLALWKQETFAHTTPLRGDKDG